MSGSKQISSKNISNESSKVTLNFKNPKNLIQVKPIIRRPVFSHGGFNSARATS